MDSAPDPRRRFLAHPETPAQAGVLRFRLADGDAPRWTIHRIITCDTLTSITCDIYRPLMERRSSAYYQRRHRERLREQGLIKKELWVLSEYADELAAIERRMRQPRGGTPQAARAGQETQGEQVMSGISIQSSPLWTALALHTALAASDGVRDGAISIELIDGAEPGLYLTMHDYGDLPLFMAVVGRQIVVEAMMWPVSQVRDPARFNEELLRTHRLFPLSTLGIETIDGEAVYIMFGALSASSSLPDVLFEIETLADNVIRASEAYEWHLQVAA
jgi:uncharacterized protein